MRSTKYFKAKGSWTRLSTKNFPIKSLGDFLQSTAHKSGRDSKPCWILPKVKGKAPPPWAKATRSFGNCSKTPPKIIEQIARDVSAGIPTSQGSQYFAMRS